jgi:hypothetical protein
MTRNDFLFGFLAVLALCTLALVAGCKEEEQPPLVWDPNDVGAGTPVISSVNPASALGGITQVSIKGKNFSPIDTNNIVYFGSAKGTIASATDSLLVVVPPDLDEAGYQIKVVVAGAFAYATYGPYTVQHAGIEYGGFTDLDEVYSLAVDASEVVYAQLKAASGDTARVFTVAPIAPYTQHVRYGVLKTSTGQPWPKASDMRIGPGGVLYLQQTNNANLYRIPQGGGATQFYLALPAKANALDFDQNGNIFAGGDRAGMNVVKPDGSARIVGSFGTMTIRAIKVFNGNVYVAAGAPTGTPPVATTGVWKAPILNSDGDLGAAVQIFAWSSAPGTFPASTVWSLAIAADSTIYVGCENTDPILAIPPSGAPAALYPGVLSPPATQLIWGTGEYLYCNRDNSDGTKRRLIRIAMGKPGAPDYGRH